MVHQQHLLDVNADCRFEIVTAYGWCTAWRARKEASIRGEEFGTIGESLLERALTMYLLALSARHVVLSLPPSLDYNLATQIGQALIYVVAHLADFHAMSSFCSAKTSRAREILFILRCVGAWTAGRLRK